jgi:hypothetical protein
MQGEWLDPVDERPWYAQGPYRLMYAAMATAPLTVALGYSEGAALTFLMVVSLLVGLLLAGGAVWWDVKSGLASDFDENTKTGVLVALALAPIIAAGVAFDTRGWDSLQLLSNVLAGITIAAVPIIFLPSAARRVLVSLVLLFHFGGILTAVTAVQPPNNAPMPWLPSVLWHRVYRPYLTFFYMNNAYHFYSPDPGPPQLLWFQVVFEDGSTQWKRIVRREDFPTRQQYQRFLSLTESTRMAEAAPPGKIAELQKKRIVINNAKLYKDPYGKAQRIPFSGGFDINFQYQEPVELAKKYLSSYASYVARTEVSSKNPGLNVKSVRVYRLQHQLISAAQMAAGLSPLDPTLFLVWYEGEYDKAGKLIYKPLSSRDEKTIRYPVARPDGSSMMMEAPAQDPFLYWMLPIYREPKPGFENSANLDDYILIDALQLHSGDDPWDY